MTMEKIMTKGEYLEDIINNFQEGDRLEHGVDAIRFYGGEVPLSVYDIATSVAIYF